MLPLSMPYICSSEYRTLPHILLSYIWKLTPNLIHVQDNSTNQDSPFTIVQDLHPPSPERCDQVNRSEPSMVFPLEIFDIIASWVGSPKDLLSLALTCKTLSDVVLTSHIHYRSVSFSFTRRDLISLRKSLQKPVLRLQNVNTLSMRIPYFERGPTFVNSELFERSMRWMAKVDTLTLQCEVSHLENWPTGFLLGFRQISDRKGLKNLRLLFPHMCLPERVARELEEVRLDSYSVVLY